MDVKEVMISDVIYCSPDDEVSKVARMLKDNNISGMPVVDGDKVVGMISEFDLLKLLEIPEHSDLWLPSPFEIIEVPIRELISWEETKRMLSDVGAMPVKKLMEKDVYSVSPGNSIEDASTLMAKHKITRLPVLENGVLVGIVTRGDIIRGLGNI
ncbi:CBS domain-containing protein [Methanohalophilus levihalophilus]|uniref:CBS domain-containing protein n=1 Tax=Methanohalophilus levihalophilus TaxID=1431282 RepID=UPI001AEAF0D8|nr:CBS domain-containing protein [Methanohalophilus levihalophilus]MBP2030924.1 CBS domain-containing protein [Methanohalophilus levihalophilus]